MINHNYILH